MPAIDFSFRSEFGIQNEIYIYLYLQIIFY